MLLIYGKIFERLVFKDMLRFFLENKLVTPHQSGFKPGESSINQLLSINQEIYVSFDDEHEVRSVLLDLGKKGLYSN